MTVVGEGGGAVLLHQDAPKHPTQHRTAPRNRMIWFNTSTVLQLRNPVLKNHNNNISIILLGICDNNNFVLCNLKIRNKEVPED